MRRVLSKALLGSTILAFSFSCLAVAMYALTFLYREYNPHNPFAVRFAIFDLGVPAHFFGAGLALLLAPLQLSATVRRRAPGLHRLSGWLSTAAIVIGATGALSLARHTQGGLASGLAFSLLAPVWLLCTGNGIRHVIAGDMARHRRWMCRSIALTSSAVTLRLMLTIGGVSHLPFLPVYIFAAWSCWPVNLAICEMILRWPVISAGLRAGGQALLQGRMSRAGDAPVSPPA
jgi:hypothetical protein